MSTHRLLTGWEEELLVAAPYLQDNPVFKNMIIDFNNTTQLTNNLYEAIQLKHADKE